VRAWATFSVTCFASQLSVNRTGRCGGGGGRLSASAAPDEADIQSELDRRRPGQSRLVTPRREADTVQILSGTFDGRHWARPYASGCGTRTPGRKPTRRWRASFVHRTPTIPTWRNTASENWQGGGRSSARETIGRVAAGAIAKKILRERYGVETIAYVQQVQRIAAKVDPETVTRRQSRPTSCAAPMPRRPRA